MFGQGEVFLIYGLLLYEMDIAEAIKNITLSTLSCVHTTLCPQRPSHKPLPGGDAKALSRSALVRAYSLSSMRPSSREAFNCRRLSCKLMRMNTAST